MAKGLGVFSQLIWEGVFDIDECWIIATYWALVATGVMTRAELPSIKAFRAAAGRLDDPTHKSPGNNSNLLKALGKLAPNADAQLFVGGLSAFAKKLQQGYVASLSVESKYLPEYLKFGYDGLHQISVIVQGGKYYVMNPLAKEGSALLQISAAALAKAAGELLNDGKFHAVLIKQEPMKQPVESLPPRPPSPPTVNRYINPWEARDRYRKRHERSVAGTTQRR